MLDGVKEDTIMCWFGLRECMGLVVKYNLGALSKPSFRLSCKEWLLNCYGGMRVCG